VGVLEVKSYNLFLDLDFKKLKFDGSLAILLESEGDVTLDSTGLEILKVSSNGKPLAHKLVGEELRVQTGPFSRNLEIQYRGAVSEKLTGLYKAPYPGGYVFSTQFEAASARKLLPCFDRPECKAEFALTVKTDSDLKVISNMPEEFVKAEGAKKIVTFQKTPRMSTYLLYLGVGRFDEVEDKPSKIIIATTPGNTPKAKFALDVAKESLRFYKSYFGSPYQLPKLHLIGVPEFAEGAMENWGAITFREAYILVDENTSVRYKKVVAEVVAHEVAHQWFGNLVTMKWWDDLWLNESFATFMSYKLVESMFPQWHVWDDFLRTDTSIGMARDSLQSTHPIEVKINDPKEIDQYFDQISYSKGANIIRMIEAFTGVEGFRRGIQSYLKKNIFSNATGNELWSQLEKASGSDVRRIMSEWIRKPGFPVISVSLKAGKVTLSQERFLLSGAREKGVWPVPVTMKINGKTQRLLLDKEEQQVDTPHSLKSLKLNVDQTGFYRVDYDGVMDLVWNSQLIPVDRWGLISDAFAFTIAGRLPFQDYIALLAKYDKERENLPAYEASDQLSIFNSLVPSIAEVSSRFHRSQLEILKNKTDENSTLLRGVFMSRLAMVDQDYANDLARRFSEYSKVEPDQRQAVAVAYARSSSDFDGLVQKYKQSKGDEEKVRFLVALTSFREPALVQRALGLATGGEVKKQDVPSIVSASTNNPDGRTAVWPWVKTNLDWLNKLFEGSGNVSRLMQSIIPYVGVGRRTEVEKFFAESRPPELVKGIEVGLEKLAIYDQFVHRAGAHRAR